MPGDLHTHTTFSDGSCRADQLPYLAKAAGLSALAISDHDSLESVRYALKYQQLETVSLIPATELSAFDFERGRRVHILCYWPDDCAELQEYCALMAARRTAAVEKSMQELSEICPQFRREDALRYAGDSGGSLFKSYVMRALMEYGLAESIYGDTYHELFGRGGVAGKISHSPEYQSYQQILELVRQCRGVAVLAHPGTYKSLPLAHELAAAGLLDGVEIDHPRNTPAEREELTALAKKYNLIVTGGTDFHGMNSMHPHPIGTGLTGDDMLCRIRALALSRKGGAT